MTVTTAEILFLFSEEKAVDGAEVRNCLVRIHRDPPNVNVSMAELFQLDFPLPS